jgi:hypothetical protein
MLNRECFHMKVYLCFLLLEKLYPVIYCHFFISASVQASGLIMIIRSSLALSCRGHGFNKNQNSSRANYSKELDEKSGIQNNSASRSEHICDFKLIAWTHFGKIYKCCLKWTCFLKPYNCQFCKNPTLITLKSVVSILKHRLNHIWQYF